MNRSAEILTRRLHLRQWRDSDLEPFAQLNADPLVMAYFPSPLQRDESDAIARRCRELIDQQGWGFWAVELQESESFIGFVGLHEPRPDLPFSPCVEIGWRLASHYWGKGYATEAARYALQFGFEKLALPEVVSFTVTGNLRSRHVMERLGMHDTETTFEHPALPKYPRETHYPNTCSIASLEKIGHRLSQA
jgi:RimJ/RimL family protein N-acetyltransferase